MSFLRQSFLKILVVMLCLPCGLVFSQSDYQSEQTTAGQVAPLNPVQSNVPGEVIGASSTYTLGKDDIVKIDVRNQPEFTGNYVIDPSGNIQYTFVGDIKAEGLTKDELKAALIKELEKYVKVPEISITIAEYRSKFFYVLGDVGRPGKYPMRGDSINLRDALVSAGLPTRDAALRRTHVINPDPVKRPKPQKVDIYALLYEGQLKLDIALKPGDLVVVPTTVPSEINRALTNLLSPISRAAAVDALIEGYK